MQANFWVIPRQHSMNGTAGSDSITWRSKYGSLVITAYDSGVVDGVNEAGLAANILYLSESDYGDLRGRPPLTVSAWASFVLDNYGTVEEAVEKLRREPFRIVAPVDARTGRRVNVHLAISDRGGDR